MNFCYILLVADANPLGYGIQFIPYSIKDSQQSEYEDIELGLGGIVAVHSVETLSSEKSIGIKLSGVMNKFSMLLSYCAIPSKKLFAANGTVKANQIENSPLQSMEEIEKAP